MPHQLFTWHRRSIHAQDHRQHSEADKLLGHAIPLSLADLQGPKLRVGNDQKMDRYAGLQHRDTITFTTDEKKASKDKQVLYDLP
jgi:pyruvate kinase